MKGCGVQAGMAATMERANEDQGRRAEESMLDLEVGFLPKRLLRPMTDPMRMP